MTAVLKNAIIYDYNKKKPNGAIPKRGRNPTGKRNPPGENKN